MTTGLAALLLSTISAFLSAAQAPVATSPGRALVPRGRWHREAPGPPSVRWSILFRRTDTGDETRLLIETPAGRWALLSSQPADGAGETREDVTDLALGETVSRSLTPFPQPHTPECARIVPPDACLVLQGSRGRLASPLSAFSREGASSLKRRAAAVVSPAFLARLKGLAPALGIADLAFYSEDFLTYLEPALARLPGPDLAGSRLPGCDFDATFGYPCTADERRREDWLFRRRTPVPGPAPR